MAAEGGFEWRALRREVKSAFFPFFATREIAAASLATDPQMPLFRFAPRAAAAGAAAAAAMSRLALFAGEAMKSAGRREGTSEGDSGERLCFEPERLSLDAAAEPSGRAGLCTTPRMT